MLKKGNSREGGQINITVGETKQPEAWAQILSIPLGELRRMCTY